MIVERLAGTRVANDREDQRVAARRPHQHVAGRRVRHVGRHPATLDEPGHDRAVWPMHFGGDDSVTDRHANLDAGGLEARSDPEHVMSAVDEYDQLRSPGELAQPGRQPVEAFVRPTDKTALLKIDHGRAVDRSRGRPSRQEQLLDARHLRRDE